MALGQCQVCHNQEARYKCPKCYVAYCTLACFKSPDHSHPAPETPSSGDVSEPANDAEQSAQESSEPQAPSEPASNTQQSPLQEHADSAQTDQLLQKIADDQVIKAMLSYKSLRAHLSVLLKLLLDSSITKEPILENRKEIANMRLCELRIGGAEENELVEEFVQRVLQLQKDLST